MSETPQLLVKHEENVNSISDEVDVHFTDQVDANSAGTGSNDRLAKIGIGIVLGAVVGAVAGAWAGKVTVESVNNTVKSTGDAVKGAAVGVSQTVKGVKDAVKSVADNVNQTVKGTVDAVKGAAEDVNHNVKGTVDAVKSVAENVNHTVKGTVDVAYEERLVADEQQVKPGEVGIEQQVETQTAYMLVPVDKQRVVE